MSIVFGAIASVFLGVTIWFACIDAHFPTPWFYGLMGALIACMGLLSFPRQGH